MHYQYLTNIQNIHNHIMKDSRHGGHIMTTMLKSQLKTKGRVQRSQISGQTVMLFVLLILQPTSV